MKINNQTEFNTRQLGALIRESLKREGWSASYRKHVRVHVSHRLRNYGTRGRAPYGSYDNPHLGFRLFLRLGDTNREIASVVAHEAAHNHGIRHKRMEPRIRRGGNGAEWDWADFFPLGRKAPKAKALTLRARPADQKLAHAEKMLGRAETRLKRASTIARNWRVKVRYYERRLAAEKAAALQGGGE